jgi:hypothetical protein
MNNRAKYSAMRPALFASVMIVAMLSGCSSPSRIASGSSSETVVGRIVSADGKPAPGAAVTLFPEHYDPYKGPGQHSLSTDTTDENGVYSLRVPDVSVRYTIGAVQCVLRTRAMVTDIMIIGDSTPVSDATLGIPGTIKAAIPVNADFQNGYMYVPGANIKVDLSGASGFVVLDSVPAGTIPEIYYAVKNSDIVQTIRYDVLVYSGDTSKIFCPGWRYSRQVYFNTTPSGADVAGTITNFPVLVRLTGANFAFAGARADGGDIRFAKQDGTLLNYEIERWEAAQGAAEIWVKVDTIFGNDSAHYICMYWGTSAMDSAGSVTGVTNGAAVFDTSNGFQGVWHFAEAGNAPAEDATNNRFQGAPYGMTAASAVPGVIGVARWFDGKSTYLTVPGSASSALNFPENGSFTLSAWVFADSLDNNFHEIISKGDLDYGMQLHNINKWEITDFLDATGWQTVRFSATAQTWKYVVGVRDGTREYLYVDGALASDSIALRDSTGRNETFDLCIGRQADASSRYWSGAIDEVNITNVARSPDWIKLSYMNQKAINKLVEFR